VEFHSGGRYFSLAEDRDVTRDDCRIFGDEYRYMSPRQFRVQFDMEAENPTVSIRGYVDSSVVNPTILKRGSHLEQLGDKPVILHDGDVIQVGPVSLEVKIVRSVE